MAKTAEPARGRTKRAATRKRGDGGAGASGQRRTRRITKPAANRVTQRANKPVRKPAAKRSGGGASQTAPATRQPKRNAKRRGGRGAEPTRTARAGRSVRTGKRARRATVRTARTGAHGAVAALGRARGYAVAVSVVERGAAELELVEGRWARGEQRARGGRGRTRGRLATSGRAVVSPRCRRALATLGHAQRLRIMLKLLEGPGTYRTLQKATKLKVGPLYHHVKELRLAGLLLPKQRDLYELTRAGRNLILLALAAGTLVGDRRRRP